MNLGENIYRLRTEKNMSQGDLADALDVSRQSVSKWENNSAVPELEKLIKLAQVFRISIDELVTGETKEDAAKSTPPLQSDPYQAAPIQQKLSAAQIFGIILLVFGCLCLIVFTVVGIFVGAWPMGLCIAVPFLACGTICLLCKKNVGLKCIWAIYLPFWFVCNVLIVRHYGAIQYIISGGLILTFFVLTFITLRRMIVGQIILPRWAKVLLIIAMILGLLLTVFFSLPPIQNDDFSVKENSVIVTPGDPSVSK